MSLVLGFDTSAAYIGVALMRGDTCLAAAHEEMARGQAERLFPLIDEILKEAGAGFDDLDAIGVGIGPGNFTGVRISVSAARGLSLSLRIPAVGVSLLEAVAHGTAGPVVSCLSAPRDQAYVQGHGTSAEIAPQLIAIADMSPDWAEAGLTCVGSAAPEVAGTISAQHRPAAYAPASAIARLASARWQGHIDRPVPMYLKPADAAPSRDTPPARLDDA